MRTYSLKTVIGDRPGDVVTTLTVADDDTGAFMVVKVLGAPARPRSNPCSHPPARSPPVPRLGS